MSLSGWHAASLEPSAGSDEFDPPNPTSEQPRSNTAAWTIVSLSLAVFACGAVLLAWSLLGQREDLWPVGLPLALIGQAGLIVGLVLQIDGLTGRVTAPQANNRLPHARHRQTPISLH